MTLEEIKNLEHIKVIEAEHLITIIPEIDYWAVVEDIPESQIHYDAFDMVRQDEYSRMWVETESPVDPSILDASL